MTKDVLSSQPQNGTSSRSDSSGVCSRPKRGVGGGVGSVHGSNALAFTEDPDFSSGDLDVALTMIGVLTLVKRFWKDLSRDGLALMEAYAFGEGYLEEPDGGSRSGGSNERIARVDD